MKDIFEGLFQIVASAFIVLFLQIKKLFTNSKKNSPNSHH